MDLSILIPARNEMFLARTIEDILEHIEGDAEIIAVCDGAWPDPPVPDHPRVHLIYHSQSIGQRAATNEAARMATGKFIMKADAHCSFAQGFDVKLMADCEPDWIVVPQMRNLHAFDWRCRGCGRRIYQGSQPESCKKCAGETFEMVVVWEPRAHTRNAFMRFDSDLRFGYWKTFKKRPEARGDLAPTMSLLGACWLMRRSLYWELGGLDEAHGSWGQMGTEIACKAWLSGGALMVNKKTWFAHMFRTQNGFSFPYPNPGAEKAREYSKWLWSGDNWPGAAHPLSWLVDKFRPIPGWPLSQGLVYYTDNEADEAITAPVRRQIKRAAGDRQIVSVSLRPVEFGQNITLDDERGALTMFRQILAGLEESQADVIFLVEHDVLYHPSHFDFEPEKEDVFYYNQNTWKVDAATGKALFYYANQTSGLCAYRPLLLEHYRKRVAMVERHGFSRRIGFEPGTHRRKERVDNYTAQTWMSEYPNIDIRHGRNLTASRWSKEEFRNQKHCKGWTEADEVPGWGRTKGRFSEFLQERN